MRDQRAKVETTHHGGGKVGVDTRVSRFHPCHQVCGEEPVWPSHHGHRHMLGAGGAQRGTSEEALVWEIPPSWGWRGGAAPRAAGPQWRRAPALCGHSPSREGRLGQPGTHRWLARRGQLPPTCGEESSSRGCPCSLSGDGASQQMKRMWM